MLTKLNKFLKGQRGQGFVEYALIIALIVVICIVAARSLGTSASTAMSRAAASLTV